MTDTASGTNALTEMGSRLAFSKKLHAVTNKIHATRAVDEIITELGGDVCALFEADRLTIYAATDDKSHIVSRVKTGLNAFKNLKLPVSPHSIAGYCALHKAVLNIADVHDDEELRRYGPELRFLKEIDNRTSYRTRQMLALPIVDDAGELLGAIQLINTLSGLPFPQLAVDGAQELAKTLAIAFRHRQQPQRTLRTHYDHLVQQGVLSAAELELAVRAARRKEESLEDVLLNEFQVKRAQLGEALAQFYEIPYEPFRADRIKPADLLRNIKRGYVETGLWLPLDETRDGLVVATPDPERVKGTRAVEQLFPKHKALYKVCTQKDFAEMVDLFFGEEAEQGSIGEMLSTLEDDGTSDADIPADDASAASDNELVKLVNKIIMDAYKQGASDIHIEPYPGKGKTQVRFRKDGTLFPYIEIPASLRNPLVARLKIMCDLDISEKRKPQDGKISFKKFGPLNIELRVATIPSAGGVEDVVMRILAAGEPIPLDKLGLSERNLATAKKEIVKPYGLFLVCGPTGSGKTTTLHSVLGYINTSETKIWTAEDPVEITQKGLRQVQVLPKTGFTFAAAMRAFLRADPDVIMVGEMRDKETVATGIEASLTGHLVFSTLHTNSAPESIVRLLDMGMDPFNFADALLGILAQRLAKRLCSQCKQEYVPDDEEVQALLSEYCLELEHSPQWQRDPEAARGEVLDGWRRSFGGKEGKFKMYKPVGCDACSGTGYKGRLGLHELLVCSDAIKKHIQEHARVAEVLSTALAEGMRTLKQDGIEKVLQGITDLHQVRAVCIK